MNKISMSIGALYGLVLFEFESRFEQELMNRLTDPFVRSPLENLLREASK